MTAGRKDHSTHFGLGGLVLWHNLGEDGRSSAPQEDRTQPGAGLREQFRVRAVFGHRYPDPAQLFGGRSAAGTQRLARGVRVGRRVGEVLHTPSSRNPDQQKLTDAKKIYQAIGRLQERYPRVARYYRMDYDGEPNVLSWQEDQEKKAVAEKLDGGCVLKTDRRI